MDIRRLGSRVASWLGEMMPERWCWVEERDGVELRVEGFLERVVAPRLRWTGFGGRGGGGDGVGKIGNHQIYPLKGKST